MRRDHAYDSDTDSGINMTPLIDMVFIILIFFIVTSSFVKESGVEVRRPEAQSAARQEQAGIVVAITADGEVWLDGKVIDPRGLRGAIKRLLAANPEAGLVVLADEQAPAGLAVRAIDQARLAGVANVALGAARPKP